ncbi:hypothetical protein IGI37_001454 [Enterococcus sp. AZ194]|uniref:RNA polymerase sigma factor n=1 Tax=Enterococcus sp. AZ194 TaxID=2774629 RepID=UPI003F24B905
MENELPDDLFFEQLYKEFEQKIFFLAFSIINNKEQAEDITQDIFEQLYGQLPTLKSYDSLRLKKFILRMTKNKTIDSYRKNRVENEFKENSQEHERLTNNVEEHFDTLLTEELLQKVRTNLKEPYVQVFLYRIYYGLSTKETAELLAIQPDTVKKRLERAKKKVRIILEGETEYE